MAGGRAGGRVDEWTRGQAAARKDGRAGGRANGRTGGQADGRTRGRAAVRADGRRHVPKLLEDILFNTREHLGNRLFCLHASSLQQVTEQTEHTRCNCTW